MLSLSFSIYIEPTILTAYAATHNKINYIKLMTIYDDNGTYAWLTASPAHAIAPPSPNCDVCLFESSIVSDRKPNTEEWLTESSGNEDMKKSLFTFLSSKSAGVRGCSNSGSFGCRLHSRMRIRWRTISYRRENERTLDQILDYLSQNVHILV